MPNSIKSKHVVVPIDILDRLKKRQRPHQTLGGVIEELLNTVETIEKLPDVPKPKSLE